MSNRDGDCLHLRHDWCKNCAYRKFYELYCFKSRTTGEWFYGGLCLDGVYRDWKVGRPDTNA